ncbi:hypothetical protein [Serpentinicella alkaliphila]|uniref:Uncharacterized protein n=1 Tax=Serpentinicella alkaliphila TaxID=1734049 RepID=A0A4R2T8U1_9FIRM|nr:hypothetical protein [Serpentinicella alkaliphila]QUH26585.1 hypothetical protein HZR23_13210 [Serpentinicella alkaliphila]TCP99070.1 hypothetical protein EDD79_103733 [Serpentinicella alkaliphila]
MLAYDYSDVAYPKKLTERVARAYQSRAYLPLVDSINGARLSLFRDLLKSNGCKIGEDVQVPDRLASARAGIVTFGSNTFAYAEGSFIILTCYVVDVELEYDSETMENRCPPN